MSENQSLMNRSHCDHGSSTRKTPKNENETEDYGQSRNIVFFSPWKSRLSTKYTQWSPHDRRGKSRLVLDKNFSRDIVILWRSEMLLNAMFGWRVRHKVYARAGSKAGNTARCCSQPQIETRTISGETQSNSQAIMDHVDHSGPAWTFNSWTITIFHRLIAVK